MGLHIYNTLTRQKEPFEPINPPKVGMYVCGVTVYDDCHLGHARALISFDMIYRYLRQKGYDVTFVRNYTDVDDKIIDRANRDGVPWHEVAARYIRSFDEDMAALKIHSPTHQPKATESISEIIKLVEALVRGGFAYQAGGDVFYSVRKKEDYGKLSGKKIDELEAGARVEVHEAKKDPLDFSLWKASKPGEPSWDSPWGSGRPGWHIECSAMSLRYLGDSFDIHGGGRDLIFPHHENEIAQSEAATSKPFVRLWMHNGFVNMESEKMSKSLGNFLSLKFLLKRFEPEVIRLFILSAHYRSPLDYTEGLMESIRQSLNRWYGTLDRIRKSGSSSATAGKAAKNLADKIHKLRGEYDRAMDDDFNTAKVVGLLFDLSREWNKALDGGAKADRETTELFLTTVSSIHDVLGVFGSDPEVYLRKETARVLETSGLTEAAIGKEIELRKKARGAKDWAQADRIRKGLLEKGIVLKDNPDGSTEWGVV